jgi:hypothetical protein
MSTDAHGHERRAVAFKIEDAVGGCVNRGSFFAPLWFVVVSSSPAPTVWLIFCPLVVRRGIVLAWANSLATACLRDDLIIASELT